MALIVRDELLKLLYPGLGLRHGLGYEPSADTLTCNRCGFQFPRNELLALLEDEEYMALKVWADKHKEICDQPTPA